MIFLGKLGEEKFPHKKLALPRCKPYGLRHGMIAKFVSGKKKFFSVLFKGHWLFSYLSICGRPFINLSEVLAFIEVFVHVLYIIRNKITFYVQMISDASLWCYSRNANTYPAPPRSVQENDYMLLPLTGRKFGRLRKFGRIKRKANRKMS